MITEKSLLRCSQLLIGHGKSNLAGPIDFCLKSGEVVALMGQNGSGKSTFLKTLAGRIPPLSGEINLFEKSSWTDAERSRYLALVRMNGIAAGRMKVREFVSLGRLPYAGFLDGRSKNDEEIVDEALRLLELDAFENRYVSELSDGERSRVFLAEAVAQQVSVLLLDEPGAFLDIPWNRKLYTTLRELARQRNMGIVVSTHSVEYAETYCDRLLVIEGSCFMEAPAKEARARGILAWTE